MIEKISTGSLITERLNSIWKYIKDHQHSNEDWLNFHKRLIYIDQNQHHNKIHDLTSTDDHDDILTTSVKVPSYLSPIKYLRTLYNYKTATLLNRPPKLTNAYFSYEIIYGGNSNSNNIYIDNLYNIFNFIIPQKSYIRMNYCLINDDIPNQSDRTRLRENLHFTSDNNATSLIFLKYHGKVKLTIKDSKSVATNYGYLNSEDFNYVDARDHYKVNSGASLPKNTIIANHILFSRMFNVYTESSPSSIKPLLIGLNGGRYSSNNHHTYLYIAFPYMSTNPIEPTIDITDKTDLSNIKYIYHFNINFDESSYKSYNTHPLIHNATISKFTNNQIITSQYKYSLSPGMGIPFTFDGSKQSELPYVYMANYNMGEFIGYEYDHIITLAFDIAEIYRYIDAYFKITVHLSGKEYNIVIPKAPVWVGDYRKKQ